jgi:hypothetical protein
MERRDADPSACSEAGRPTRDEQRAASHGEYRPEDGRDDHDGDGSFTFAAVTAPGVVGDGEHGGARHDPREPEQDASPDESPAAAALGHGLAEPEVDLNATPTHLGAHQREEAHGADHAASHIGGEYRIDGPTPRKGQLARDDEQPTDAQQHAPEAPEGADATHPQRLVMPSLGVARERVRGPGGLPGRCLRVAPLRRRADWGARP